MSQVLRVEGLLLPHHPHNLPAFIDSVQSHANHQQPPSPVVYPLHLIKLGGGGSIELVQLQLQLTRSKAFDLHGEITGQALLHASQFSSKYSSSSCFVLPFYCCLAPSSLHNLQSNSNMVFACLEYQDDILSIDFLISSWTHYKLDTARVAAKPPKQI